MITVKFIIYIILPIILCLFVILVIGYYQRRNKELRWIIKRVRAESDSDCKEIRILDKKNEKLKEGNRELRTENKNLRLEKNKLKIQLNKVKNG